MTVNRCYESVATVKKEQLKMVHLKTNSAPNRSVRYFQALFGYLTSVDTVDLKHPEKVWILFISLFIIYLYSLPLETEEINGCPL